jgi:hypothetical protein
VGGACVEAHHRVRLTLKRPWSDGTDALDMDALALLARLASSVPPLRQRSSKGMDREYHWVASGRINIPQHVPQYRLLKTTLRKAGLRGPFERLVLI